MAVPAGRDDRLISTLSHQLRTPLAVIIGYAELLQHREDEETRREAPVRIQEAAEELSLMIDDLLIVLAIDSGLLSIDPAPIELKAVVVDAIECLDARFDKHLFEARCPDSDSWPLVFAHREHLTRIFTSLLLNAYKYSPDGCRVTITADEEEGFATVSVSDEGRGLTEEQLAALFERFSPIDVPGRPDIRSTGLELYKVRRLVELHGGSIRAESKPGKGSTLTFTLPLARPDLE